MEKFSLRGVFPPGAYWALLFGVVSEHALCSRGWCAYGLSFVGREIISTKPKKKKNRFPVLKFIKPLTFHHRFKLISGAPLPGLSKLKYSVLISRGAAIPLSLDLMLLLLPMCRITITKIRYYITWTPIEESAWFHRQVAYTMLFYAIVHTSAHYVK